jgi:hypothetical protein
MTKSMQRFDWLGTRFLFGMVALGSLALAYCGAHVSRADVKSGSTDDIARQITVFGIIATPGGKGVDTDLASIKTQLDQLMPKHSFRLLDARNKRIIAGESVSCELGNGYKVETTLVNATDENGRVQLRCELYENQDRRFSTLVKTPVNQLFFCERVLPDGSELLIGVGAR